MYSSPQAAISKLRQHHTVVKYAEDAHVRYQGVILPTALHVQSVAYVGTD